MKSFHESVWSDDIYLGPSFAFRVGNDNKAPLSSKVVQTGWDVGIGFDIVNFIQIAGASGSVSVMPSAAIHLIPTPL